MAGVAPGGPKRPSQTADAVTTRHVAGLGSKGNLSMRKYAGVIFGLVASMILATAVLASTIGPNTINNRNPGWNSPIFGTGNGTVTFRIRNCASSDSSLHFDLMHHWPIVPSTGEGHQSYTCANNATWRPHSWSIGGADYSVEYELLHNSATITLNYQIIYP
jgi:hypothetical protein